jgi:hypothetical protein
VTLIEFLAVIAGIAVIWLGLYLAFVGIGSLGLQACGLRVRDTDGTVTVFWLGWAIVLAFLQLWHLFSRIDWHSLAVVCLLGLLGLATQAKDFWSFSLGKSLSRPFWSVLLLATTAWLAGQAILPPAIYDTGLYYLPSVRWITSFPIVPGLGNLHGRLAFNSSYFLYVAMLGSGPWIYRGYHLANGLLFLAVFIQGLQAAFRLFTKQMSSWRVSDLFCVLILPAALYQAVDFGISSPAPDSAIFLLGIVLSERLFRLLSDAKISQEEVSYSLALVFAVAVAGITVKLSFGVLALTGSLLALRLEFQRAVRRHGFEAGRPVILSVGGVFLMLILWMGRGVILSGYIAYPSSVGAFPVEWRIPLESTVREVNSIRSWARAPHLHWSEVLGNWNWLKPWLIRIWSSQRFEVIMPLLLTVIAGLLAFLCRRLAKVRLTTAGLPVLIPPICCLVFWFATAPDPRFAGASFWILGAGSLSVVASGLCQANKTGVSCALVALFLFLCIAPASEMTFWPGSRQDQGLYTYQVPKLKEFTTSSGLMLYVPIDNDQCWDAPLPCTPYPIEDLRLRKADDMHYGFVLDDSAQSGILPAVQLSKAASAFRG